MLKDGKDRGLFEAESQDMGRSDQSQDWAFCVELRPGLRSLFGATVSRVHPGQLWPEREACSPLSSAAVYNVSRDPPPPLSSMEE
jgi:hypothetical protein